MKTASKQFERLSPAARSLISRVNLFSILPCEFEDSQIIETHISLLFIGKQFVLKFKKSVEFPFVDHRKISSRWESAVNEVVLNQRTSEGIYLGLLPIFTSDTPLSIAQPLEVEINEKCPVNLIEVGVLMRTIPQDNLLDNLIKNNSVTVKDHILPLAKRLATFHREQREIESKHPSTTDYYLTIKRLAEDNFSIFNEENSNLVSEDDSLILKSVSSYCDTYLKNNKLLLSSRQDNNLIIDGHGDLRAEHVCYWPSEISVIDCIEFSNSIRRVDILNDIAFLRMDLDFQNRPDLSNELLNHYFHYSSTPAEEIELLNFYSSYRAMVRAKVELLRTIEIANSKGTDTEVNSQKNKMRNYLHLASRYTYRLPTPSIIVVAGLMGVGKTTLAKWISSNIYAKVLSTDEIRKEILGTHATDKKTAYGEGKYSADSIDRIYSTQKEQAKKELLLGNPVILDGSFIKRKHRLDLLSEAKGIGVPIVFVMCELSEEKQRERLIARSNKGEKFSDGRIALMEQQRENLEMPSSEELTHTVTISMDDCKNANTICKIRNKLSTFSSSTSY